MKTRDIVQRAKEAMQGVTEGPWLVNPFRAQIDLGGTDAPICQLLWPTDLRSENETEANGHFIAWCREGVPEMVEEVERLREALGDLTLAVGEWCRPTSANGMTSPSPDHPLVIAGRKARALTDGSEGGA